MELWEMLAVLFAYYGFVHFTVYIVLDCIDFAKALKEKHNKNREGK